VNQTAPSEMNPAPASVDEGRPVSAEPSAVSRGPRKVKLTSGRVLVVDDDDDMLELVRDELASRGFAVDVASTGGDALTALQWRECDAVITDVRLERESGLDLCERIVASQPDVPVLIMTAFGDLDTAVRAIRAGAYDFIAKPFKMDMVAIALRRAVQHRQLQREVGRLRDALDRAPTVEGVLGDSRTMRNVFEMVTRVADGNATVLVTGESGTGKELVARAIHERSPRSSGEFVAINCAAMPAPLLESELFGHVKGAFTDAKVSRSGLFVRANGGTLFLDEIGEMALEMQAKLLRVLQDRRVRPVGGDTEVSFDTRIVAATNRDLDADVAAGRFREDLFYRINVVRIHVPPLRSRGNDILLLAQQFLQELAGRSGKAVTGISGTTAERLLTYDWPGNVRELQNCMERAVTLARFEELTPDDLPEKIRLHASTRLSEGDDPEQLPTLDEMERRYIRRVLSATEGNKTRAARVLGVDRRTLYRRIHRLGIDDPGSAS